MKPNFKTLLPRALFLGVACAMTCSNQPDFSMTKPTFAAEIPTKRIVKIASFGTIGDGVADDTLALQKAFDSLQAGDRLMLEAGKTYRHTDVLTIKNPGVRLSGPGTILATNEQRSGFRIDADNVTVDGGIIFKIDKTTKRWDAWEQMKVRLSGHSGIVLRNITVDGAAAAGIYIGNSSNYLLEDVTVLNTRADGIHNTDGSHDGIIRRAIVRNVGDDGVAIVSYSKDGSGKPCHNIAVESPRFYGNVWGRGFSVVGGEDITFRDIYADGSNAAAIYIGNEGDPWFTFPAKRVRILGGEIKNSNQSKTVDHGAILILTGREGYLNEDIEIADIKITNTRETASRQVGILGDSRRVQLRNFSFSGGPNHLLTANLPKEHYNAVNWTRVMPDHIGYTIQSAQPAKR